MEQSKLRKRRRRRRFENMENSPSSPSQNAFHKRRPFQIGIGLFVCAILIGAIVIGIWLITKPSSSGGGSGPNSTTIAPTTSPTSPTSTAGNESSSSTTTRPMPPQRDVKVHLNLFNTSILHVWLKAKEKGKEAVLYANFLSSASHDPLFSTKDTEWFDFFQMESKGRTGIVEFSWSNSTTILSYMYAYEPENVKTQGIRPAYICDQAKGPNAPQSFHLRPPLGWQNDPNGFSRANDGVYHLFYQHYPHSTARGPMYWGHATSNDLVNWAHQPIFLRAEDKKCGDKCGWFSGSAVPNDEHGHGGLQIFLTDHNRTRAIREIQSSIPTYDTILPSTNPVVIIGEEPKNPRPDLKLTEDFRDPNVFLGPNGYFYMTLGSKDSLGKGGVIMLYRTKEKKLNSEWIFQNVILTDNSLGTEVCECSGMVPLGDPSNGYTYYALLYARMTSIDADGRKNLSPIILGTFDGTTFKRIGEQELDFAAGSYGFQAFYDPIGHETLLIGWLANWPDWDQHSEFPSTMTLPRVLKRSGNIILQGPHPNVVRQLRGMELDGKALLRGNTVLLPNGTAYIQLGINYNYFFNGIFIRINHPDYLQLGVRVTYIGMEIVKVQKGDEPNRRYMASNAQPDIVHIFIDRDSLEVFGEKKMDGGMPRWAGTTRLTGNGKFFVDSVQLETTDRYNYVMDNCKIWEMKSAQLKGHIWG